MQRKQFDNILEARKTNDALGQPVFRFTDSEYEYLRKVLQMPHDEIMNTTDEQEFQLRNTFSFIILNVGKELRACGKELKNAFMDSMAMKMVDEAKRILYK